MNVDMGGIGEEAEGDDGTEGEEGNMPVGFTVDCWIVVPLVVVVVAAALAVVVCAGLVLGVPVELVGNGPAVVVVDVEVVGVAGVL